MPIYEYECSHCRYYLEVMQKLSDPRLRRCPSCGRNALKKLISAPVFRLKGSGWYETDFKSDQDNKRNLAGAEREETSGHAKDGKDATEAKDVKAAGAGDSGSATGTDTKAAAASEAKSDSGKDTASAKGESAPAKADAARAKTPAPRSRRGKPVPKRARAKSPKAAKRRGRH